MLYCARSQSALFARTSVGAGNGPSLRCEEAMGQCRLLTVGAVRPQLRRSAMFTVAPSQVGSSPVGAEWVRPPGIPPVGPPGKDMTPLRGWELLRACLKMPTVVGRGSCRASTTAAVRPCRTARQEPRPTAGRLFKHALSGTGFQSVIGCSPFGKNFPCCRTLNWTGRLLVPLLSAARLLLNSGKTAAPHCLRAARWRAAAGPVRSAN
jgi:hypothetical protein